MLFAAAVLGYLSALWAWPTLTQHRPVGRAAGLSVALALLVGFTVPRAIRLAIAWVQFSNSRDYTALGQRHEFAPCLSFYIAAISVLATAPWIASAAMRIADGPIRDWSPKVVWPTLGGGFVLLFSLSLILIPEGWPPRFYDASPGWTKIFYPITVPLALVATALFAIFRAIFRSLRWVRKPFLALWLLVVGREIIAFTFHSYSTEMDPRHLYFPERVAMHHSFRPNGTLHALRYPILFGPVTTTLEGWVRRSLHPYEPWYHCAPLLLYIAYFGAVYGLGAVIVCLFWRMLRAFAR